MRRALVAASGLAAACMAALPLAGCSPQDREGERAASPAPVETSARVTVEPGATSGSEPAVAAAPSGTPAEPAPARGSAGPLVVDGYELSQVEVGADPAGDFVVDAVVTNLGAERRGGILTAYLFSAGSVVGTATGTLPALDPGRSQRLTLRGLDDHRDDWDDVTFRVDAEFQVPR
jgi:hypothetical protein